MLPRAWVRLPGHVLSTISLARQAGYCRAFRAVVCSPVHGAVKAGHVLGKGIPMTVSRPVWPCRTSPSRVCKECVRVRAWLPKSAFVLILKCPLRLPCVWPSTCTNAGIGRDPVWNHSLRCANHKRMHGSWFAAHMREEGCTVVRGTTARRGRESGTHSPPHGDHTGR